MPYTRSWSDATPAGTRAANQIDDAIREFKVDLHERMDSALVTDWTTDPVVAKPEVSGKVDGKYVLFGPQILQPRQDEHDIAYDKNLVDLDTTEIMWGALSPLPVGVIITEFATVVDRVSGANATIAFYSVDFSTGVGSAAIATLVTSVAGINLIVSGVLAEGTTNDRYYAVSVVGNNPKCYGFRIKYNTPSSVNVI